MKKFSTYLLVMFMIVFWIVRIAVTIMSQMGNCNIICNFIMLSVNSKKKISRKLVIPCITCNLFWRGYNK